MTAGNPLQALSGLGQSVWLDFIRRSWLEDGTVERLIREDDLRGMTSNPAIFEKAIANGREYDAPIDAIVARGERRPLAIYEEIAVADIRQAADLLAAVYRRTHCQDGYVSLEVSPELAEDPAGTLAEARRLWQEVDRPNLMIKVPGTRTCLPVIRTLLAEGINVNITLLFSKDAYSLVAEAYLSALEERLGKGMAVARVASVASFFISRIDTLVDKQIDARSTAAAPADRARLEALKGEIAVANAKLAYALFTGLFASPRWQRLAEAGAVPQRLLWASTSAKNPAYRDVVYVEELIGRDTVNTMPPETIDAFRDHGVAKATLGEGLTEARKQLEELAVLGISLDGATDELLADGVAKFVEPFRKLLAAIAAKSAELAGSGAQGAPVTR
ncbi:MAG: transaldolase [Thermoanaerobaculia bacterium]